MKAADRPRGPGLRRREDVRATITGYLNVRGLARPGLPTRAASGSGRRAVPRPGAPAPGRQGALVSELVRGGAALAGGPRRGLEASPHTSTPGGARRAPLRSTPGRLVLAVSNSLVVGRCRFAGGPGTGNAGGGPGAAGDGIARSVRQCATRSRMYVPAARRVYGYCVYPFPAGGHPGGALRPQGPTGRRPALPRGRGAPSWSRGRMPGSFNRRG